MFPVTLPDKTLLQCQSRNYFFTSGLRENVNLFTAEKLSLFIQEKGSLSSIFSLKKRNSVTAYCMEIIRI